MDKSEQYIAMCGGAWEIQKQWPGSHGDFLAYENGRVECWLPERYKSRRMKSGFGITSTGDVVHLNKFVWLPKLNQLIEMAQVQGRRYESVTQDYFDWVKANYEPLGMPPKGFFQSMEQFWLAFIMERKFGKQWNGSSWVRFRPTRCEIIDFSTD